MVPRSLVCGGLPLGARVVPRALGAPSRPGLSRRGHRGRAPTAAPPQQRDGKVGAALNLQRGGEATALPQRDGEAATKA